MTDAIITLDPITTTTYVTYYSVDTTANVILEFTESIHSYSSIPRWSISIGKQALVKIANPIKSKTTIPSINLRAFSFPSNVRSPVITDNNRAPGSTLDKKQIIPLRKGEQNELQYALEGLKNNKTIDVISEDNKKIYHKTISSNVKNSTTARNVIKTLLNNYSNVR